MGILITGFVANNHSWRIVNYIVAGMTGALVLAVFFTMPETAFHRKSDDMQDNCPADKGDTLDETDADSKLAREVSNIDLEHVETRGQDQIYKKEGYLSRLRVFRPALTQESLVKMFTRPFPLLLVPDVLWATLVMSVSIGTFVALANNFASAFAMEYGFNSGQLGLVFLAVTVGSITGIWGGGWLSDFVAGWLTRRNNGIREPEMRLPTIVLSMLAMPVGCMLYAVGLAHHMHWIVSTIGIALGKCSKPRYFFVEPGLTR